MELIQDVKAMGVYPLRHYRWPNGLRVLLVHNPISPVAALLTHYTVGSASEADNQRGLAHFFEHMMFRETARLADGDFDRIVAECGGVGLNAYTTYDTTAYHVNVPVRHLDQIIGLEADRMANLKLSEDLIEKERGAVMGEIHMYKDMPSDIHWNTLMAKAFSRHPYRHPVIGYDEQVARFSPEDFSRFYRDHYAPNRAVIVVAGGFDENSVLDMINRAYSHIPTGAEQAPLPSPEPPPAGENRQTITHPKISSDMLYAATHSPGIRHEDTPALLALSWFLSAGMSSPLHQRLVSCGLATHAEASLLDVDWTMSSPSLFLMEAAMQQGVPAEKAEQVIQELALEIVDKGISQEDHQRTINQMKLAHFSSLRNNMGLARYVGRHWVACQDPLFGDTLEAAAERVTPDQMVDVLQRYWINSPKIIVTQRPGEKSEAA